MFFYITTKPELNQSVQSTFKQLEVIEKVLNTAGTPSHLVGISLSFRRNCIITSTGTSLSECVSCFIDNTHR